MNDTHKSVEERMQETIGARSVDDRVKEILLSMLDGCLGNFKLEDLTNEKRLIEDLNADSLAIVEIVLALEEEFGMKIPDAIVEKTNWTVGDVLAYVNERMKEGA